MPCPLPTANWGSRQHDPPPPAILPRFGSYQSDADQKKKDGRKKGLVGFWFLSPDVVPPWVVAPSVLSSCLLQVCPACPSKEGIIQNDFIAGCVKGWMARGPSPTPVLQTKRASTTWIPPWRSTPSLSERLSAVSRRLLGASSFRGFRPNSNFSGTLDPHRWGFSTDKFIHSQAPTQGSLHKQAVLVLRILIRTPRGALEDWS